MRSIRPPGNRIHSSINYTGISFGELWRLAESDSAWFDATRSATSVPTRPDSTGLNIYAKSKINSKIIFKPSQRLCKLGAAVFAP
jgi:hypothetical protein